MCAASKWRHTNPAGEYVGIASGATAYAGGGLSALTIADPGTDPTPGEAFVVTVTMAAASLKFLKAIAAATDGSAAPKCILADDADATSADIGAPAYFEGEFAHEKLTYGAGHTATTVEQAFRDADAQIYLRSIGAAA